jgi:hypothetical protein
MTTDEIITMSDHWSSAIKHALMPVTPQSSGGMQAHMTQLNGWHWIFFNFFAALLHFCSEFSRPFDNLFYTRMEIFLRGK